MFYAIINPMRKPIQNSSDSHTERFMELFMFGLTILGRHICLFDKPERTVFLEQGF